jgi:asparagine synthase (glutamine-hydrolysing)
MCGIAGIWRRDGLDVARDDVHRMKAALSHRGPDEEGDFLEGPVGLGHQRLSIIDRAHGRQPMANEDGRVQVVFNGMIYNYRPLQQLLREKGHVLATDCDTEVLVHAYEEWGVEMLSRLIGQFAFCIYDGRQFFMARDRMGEKPLYYSVQPEAFYFASEIKAILTGVRPRPRIPPDFLVFENTLSSDTLFEGIKSLPPGHYALFAEDALTTVRYWSFPSEVDEGMDERAAVRSLSDLIYDAVKIRLQSEVPVGMYLSGGLDSSIIACIARPPVVYTSYYEAPGKFDERPQAAVVARHIGAEQKLVTLTPDKVPELLRTVVYHLDQPISTSSTISSFNLARHARQDFKVVLNGQGADELFGGYGRYVLMQHEAAMAANPLFQQYRPMARRFWHPDVLGEPALRYLQLNQRVVPRTQAPLELVRSLFASKDDLLNQAAYVDCCTTLQDLITMDDRGCAHVGLESRSPFLDHRIAELAFRLPGHFKVRSGGVTKWILREAAREFVPAPIVDRLDKMGMVSPIGRWLKQDLRGWVEGLCTSLRGRGLDLPLEAPEDGDYDRRLHALVTLELWFRLFIDAAAHERIPWAPGDDPTPPAWASARP